MTDPRIIAALIWLLRMVIPLVLGSRHSSEAGAGNRHLAELRVLQAAENDTRG